MQEKENLQIKRNAVYIKAAGLAFDFGFIIVIPLLIGVFLSDKINRWAHTSYATPIAIILSILISGYFVWKEINQIRQDLKDLSKAKDNKE